MYFPLTAKAFSFRPLEKEENPPKFVGQCAFRKIRKISAKGITGLPQIRSFGELSELDAADTEDSRSESTDGDVHDLGGGNAMERTMLALWERCRQQELFHYDVTTCSTKTIPGTYSFVAQLNEGRGSKKRQTEYRVDRVVQEFDERKFNFTKASMKEVLFRFDTCNAEGIHIEESASAGRSPDLVMINVSPIEYGHVLLVPRVLDRVQQLVDARSMLLALQFTSAIGSPFFRLGYNSLGAYATINHQHFQGYYLPPAYPVERAQCEVLPNARLNGEGVRVSRLVGYPVRGWVFEMSALFEESLLPLARKVAEVCARLQAMDIPHNLLICDCGARVFLWPQCYSKKQADGLVPEELLATGVNPAAFEIAGHVIFKSRQDYEDCTQAGIWELLSAVSLTEEHFMDLTRSLG